MRPGTTRSCLFCAVTGMVFLAGAGRLHAGTPPGACGLELLVVAALASADRTPEGPLPEAVVKTVRERFPEAAVVRYDRDRVRGVTCYDVSLRLEAQSATLVEIAADGSLGEIETPVDLDDLPLADQARIRLAVGAGDVCSVGRCIRLGRPSRGTFVPLEAPTGSYRITYQRRDRRRELVLAFTPAATIEVGLCTGFED